MISRRIFLRGAAAIGVCARLALPLKQHPATQQYGMFCTVDAATFISPTLLTAVMLAIYNDTYISAIMAGYAPMTEGEFVDHTGFMLTNPRTNPHVYVTSHNPAIGGPAVGLKLYCRKMVALEFPPAPATRAYIIRAVLEAMLVEMGHEDVEDDTNDTADVER